MTSQVSRVREVTTFILNGKEVPLIFVKSEHTLNDIEIAKKRLLKILLIR